MADVQNAVVDRWTWVNGRTPEDGFPNGHQCHLAKDNESEDESGGKAERKPQRSKCGFCKLPDADHVTGDCPELAQATCGKCGEKGHTKKFCTAESSDDEEDSGDEKFICRRVPKKERKVRVSRHVYFTDKATDAERYCF